MLESLQAVTSCPELTGLQRVAGFVTWMNILRVFAIVGAVSCAAFLLFKWFGWLLELFLEIPKEIYETLGFVVSVALIVSTGHFDETNRLWPLLGGSLLFGAMLLITNELHHWMMKHDRLFGILFIVWSVVALYYQDSTVGFIAAGAFMGMVGFSAAVIPCGYVIGFQDKDSLARATTAGFIMLIGFVLMKVFGITTLHVFEKGALWFGAFVGYLGILIASSVWYEGRRASYIVMQLVTVVLGMAAIAIGSVFAIQPLLGIGGTFFVLYLIEKPFEIPNKSTTGFAAIGLGVSAALGLGVWWAQNHMDLVRPFLLF